jgi:hypothetical protein
MRQVAIGTMQSILAAVLLILGTTASAPGAGAPHHEARVSRLRSTPIVSPLNRYAISPPLRTLASASNSSATDAGHRVIPLRHAGPLPKGKSNSLKVPIQPKVAPRIPAASNSFDGVGNGFTGPQGTFTVNEAPPDTNGAVGPQDYVQIVNTSLAIFNKDPSRGAVGAIRVGPVPNSNLWSGVGGLCGVDNDGDPIVVYDSIANRWVISQFAVRNATTETDECIAVSTGSDPTGSYNRYVAPYTNVFIDYPKVALWPDAYYFTYNLFQLTTNGAFIAPLACAFDRSAMLNGAAASQVCFQFSNNDFSLLPSTLDGSRLPPGGSPNYLVELGTTTSLTLWKFHVDFVTPNNSTITGPFNIAVASFSLPCSNGGVCIPQLGTTQQLDSLGSRLMYRLAYRNFGSYESLVVDHAITAGSSVGMRWYEIRTPSGTPTLFQEGTYAPDTNYRWMGSIAEDRLGDMAMGFSVSSSAMHPGISFTGRLASDALGTMPQGETSLIVGNGSQTGNKLSRWGDYSSMTVDPTDDCTFWYTNEYIPSDGSFNWKTRIGSFAFPGCIGTQLIQNGGFESGAANWTEFSYGGQQAIHASLQAHSGVEAFFPCGYPACDDRVSQTFTVPATVTSAKLQLWLRSFSSLGTMPGAPCLDRFSATLAAPDGTVISDSVIAPLCETVATGGYALESYDVTGLLQAHAGQQLILTLRGTTANLTGDAGTFTSWGVDDVSLLAS